MRTGALTALCGCLCAAMLGLRAEGRAFFYPTAARTGKNLLADGWQPPDAGGAGSSAVKHAVGKGGPFSDDTPVRRVWCDRRQPGYWCNAAKVGRGRTYLSGTWAKMSPSRLLLNHYSRKSGTSCTMDARLYYCNWFSGQLVPYFSDRTRELLAGDPGKWRLFYRTMTFPQGMPDDRVDIGFGLYLSAGDITFADSFFVDVTDLPRTMDVLLEGERPFVRLTVRDMESRDMLWEKAFDPPASDFACTLPAAVDAFRGGDIPSGHVLTIFYADGEQKAVYAPEQGCAASL